MAGEPIDWKPPETLTPEWRDYVDSLYPSPEELSQDILRRIPEEGREAELWSWIALGIRIIETMYTTQIAHGTPQRDRVIQVLRDYYGLHYFYAPEIYGPAESQRVAKENDDETSPGVPEARESELAREQDDDVSGGRPTGPGPALD